MSRATDLAMAEQQRGWIAWLPGLVTLRNYRAAWLVHDIAAGLVLTTMLVPVGIAYAVASGGPDSSLAAVILGVVFPLSGGDPGRAVALAGMMAIVSGLVCILAGAARLGFVTELLSKPIRYGYMNGIALTVLVSQLPKLFGFSIDADGPLRKLWAIAGAIAGGRGFPISSSSSRTPVAEAAGAHTQPTGVVGAVAVALLLLVAPNLLRHLPAAALAAVVIASAIGLIEVSDLVRIFRIQRWEFWLSIFCFVGVAVFGAIPGIGLSIVIAVIEFLWDGWRPHSAVLGRAEGVKGYHDITRYPDARQIPGLVRFRWDAPLFFANAELFKERVLHAIAKAPTPVRWLVVAAEPVTSVDVTAADMLAELDERLHEEGIELCFAELKDPVKDKLKRFGVFTGIGEDFFFPTVGVAAGSYLASHAVDWVDWEDRRPAKADVS